MTGTNGTGHGTGQFGAQISDSIDGTLGTAAVKRENPRLAVLISSGKAPGR
jgi:hypothetical protein